MLFRLQKYKKFESNSQQGAWTTISKSSCFDCKSTKNLRAIHNDTGIRRLGHSVVSTAKVQKIWEQFTTAFRLDLLWSKLFRLQKYKKFESNSQLLTAWNLLSFGCFDCKSTKNLRAIHNLLVCQVILLGVVSTAKVQKIWEQFTTVTITNSRGSSCFDCKSTKNLRAIHNSVVMPVKVLDVVSTAKVQKIWEQFTTGSCAKQAERGCFDCKSTKNLRAIHNTGKSPITPCKVVSTAKVQKIWEQFTTVILLPSISLLLFRLQKYKKFESNSQLQINRS